MHAILRHEGSVAAFLELRELLARALALHLARGAKRQNRNLDLLDGGGGIARLHRRTRRGGKGQDARDNVAVVDPELGSKGHASFIVPPGTKGLSQVSLQHDIPIAFGVLTVDSIEQAIERAGTKAGNKGAEAAMSTIEMVNLLREIGK